MASTSARPAAGPSRIATATARFSSMTGDESARAQHVVEADDLGPVGRRGVRRLGVHGGDRRLNRVRAEPSRRRAPARPAAMPSAICSPVPQRAILIVEQDQLARRRRARRAPRFVQQHQREQPERLGLRQQLDEQPAEPDRFAGQIVPRHRRAGGRRVALVEHQIDHAQHRVEPLGQLGLRRHLVGNARVADLAPSRARCAARASAPASETPARSPRSSGRRPRAASAPPARRARAPGGSR